MYNMESPSEEKRKWHVKSTDETLSILKSGYDGLSEEERVERLKQYGPNKLPESKSDSLFVIFLRQFQSPLIYLLLVAGVLIVLLGELVDSAIIFFVLLFNAIAGTVQAGRAQNTMRALQKITKTKATVFQSGREVVVDDVDVVPGDVIFLAEGDKVPADARLLTVNNLRVNESALTGEAEPAGKSLEKIDNQDASPADQKNMVFKGTFVVAGNAKAVVVGTGLNTFIGGISKQISEIDTEIPLQRNIKRLSHIIIIVVLVLGVGVFSLGLLVGQELETMFTLAIAVIISAVPEGLPIVMTLLLASGVWRMGKRNVLVKRLQAVEALGEAKVIAVDKTGTITKNELAVVFARTSLNTYTVEASGFAPIGKVTLGDSGIDIEEHEDLKRLALLSQLCSHANISLESDTKLWNVQGDPTEGAMSVFATKLDMDKSVVANDYKVRDEIPFDSGLKYHATYYSASSGGLLAVAGAPERVLTLVSKVWKDGEERDITDADRSEFITQMESMSADALRVIAVAERSLDLPEKLEPGDVNDLTLVGLLGMSDGLREEVPEALERTRSAGIKVVMITGDHKNTARAIATSAGIFKEGDRVITDSDVDAMSQEELAQALEQATVFARITPEHKLSIVQAYRARGDVVAMTGDGVNDALSLVAADLGVAMGKRGTEVAKEASDLVLLDDNFGSIVSAVEEGRGVYVNIKKVLLFLFSTSVGEILIIVGAMLLMLPVPVLAAQLIWINLVTDGFLDVGLALEPKEKDLLRRRFVKPNTFFIDGWMLQRMLLMSSTMAIGTLFVFGMYYQEDLAKAMTLAVTLMAVCQWFKVWACRSQHQSVLTIDPFSNRYILYMTVLVIGLHFFALHNPFMQNLLNLQPLSFYEWVLVLGIGSLTLWVDEVRKFIFRRWEDPECLTC